MPDIKFYVPDDIYLEFITLGNERQTEIRKEIKTEFIDKVRCP